MNVTKEQSKNDQQQSSRIKEPSAPNGYDGNSSGFGWQLDSFTGSGRSAERKEGTNQPEIPIYDINPQDAKRDESAYNIFPIAERQNFDVLRGEHFRNGTLFEDPEFPATMKSLRYSSLYTIKDPSQKRLYELIVWLRPTEIIKSEDPSIKPHLFENGYSRFDVKQGAVGNCWALAAMGNLTIHPHLFSKVVPDDQSFTEKYAGIFHFRFWQFGKWVDVVIDDRLPTYDGKLIFVKSGVENEFWIALLEKTYAKLYGSYEAIEGGLGSEALQDFTGGIVEMYDVGDMKKSSQNIFAILRKAFERGSLLTALIITSGEENDSKLKESHGLVAQHAYGITNVKFVETSNPQEKIVPLLRLRQPWGNEVEWKHAWSDDDTARWKTVSKNVQEEIDFKADHDGEFWMSLHDFETYFTKFDICHLTPDSLSKEEISEGKKWHMSMIEGTWVSGVTAGGRTSLDKNPQYQITLTEPDDDDKDSKCTLFVSLLQKHRRAMRRIGASNLSIGFLIYSLPDSDQILKPLDNLFFNKYQPIGHTPYFACYREVSFRFKYPRGTYCIIPCTAESQQEGSFMLRVFTEKKSDMKEFDDDVRLEELGSQTGMRTSHSLYIQESDKQIMEMFLKVAKRDLEINWLELKAILDSAMKDDTNNKGFSEDVCRSIAALSDVDHSGKLDYVEFKKLWIDINNWKVIFKLLNKDNKGTISSYELREALLSTGYHVNNHILIDLMHRYGNKDHEFSFEIFILCALKVKAMLALFNWKFDDKTKTANFRLDEWMEGTLYS